MNYRYLLTGSLLCAIFACQPGKQKVTIKDQPASVLDAQAAIAHMRVESPLQVQLVAAEPLVVAPVAMSFDEKGRAWVVEMTSYMPDTAGTGEANMNGKIVILADTNHDGRMDTRRVFLDSLVLPRAVCLVGNGVLVAEPPRLWFVENNQDHPGKRTLVDSAYADGGNVEHQPNGLFRAMDNWIYNAKSAKRYRLQNGRWIISNTHFRGQWGICQDDDGRLVYNNNSANVLGDYFAPGLGAGNPHLQRVRGYDEEIVPDNRVYPLHHTGVNRGYVKDVLDDSGRLTAFTAACGPLVNRSPLLGAAFQNNVFVAEPAGNLIKRNILQPDSIYKVSGHQAYAGKEFLASDDERFRPVNLYNGPEGALYVVDMYRGIIQHKTYLTEYLKNEIRTRALTQPLNCGRIYRVVPAGSSPAIRPLATAPDSLLAALADENGWRRDRAQQLIVDGHITALVPALKQLLTHTQGNAWLHALWTLEGLGALQWTEVAPLLMSSNTYRLKTQALAVIPSIVNAQNRAAIFEAVATAVGNDPHLAVAAALDMPALQAYPKAGVLAAALSLAGTNDPYLSDALLSNAKDKELSWRASYLQMKRDTNAVFYRHLQAAINRAEEAKLAEKNKGLAKQYPRGAQLFNTICQTCHGGDGNGIHALAPPLNGSDWVNGDSRKLMSIVLFGLGGPVRVSGKTFPEITGDMPAIGNNKELSDADIAQLLSYIRQCWKNNAGPITETDIRNIRQRNAGRQKAFTMEELLQLK
ncbi:Cytochrome C oxidase, cbb3-type, subunit III [Chitinophaga costaii]|uniref:Cytochrome C oxidase, cbb3-type, subunit III n=1 Tax=Chitinophaga costaii TaxID=1335309 RepID=A0A1C4EBY6_9BACT|nr:c-type cytochrome [Chitinophaga costaii]PUZ23917.1 dehydrogenase [Chitinophaga costaii]SCC41157.1 Cytochrome C oxidase, cbb3-type, subunit III [Chitinophaga costaii]